MLQKGEFNQSKLLYNVCVFLQSQIWIETYLSSHPPNMADN